MPNEADTCRRYVVPRLQAAGWENDPHRINEQVTFTDGRIVVAGRRGRRRPGKRADYILRYQPDFPIGVVEAKPSYATPGEGLQQAKDYAEILGLKFAYATNGCGIIEFDYTTGLEREIDAFPTPAELWSRLTTDQSLSADAAEKLLTPAYHLSGKSPRYYQEIAINRAVQAVAQGNLSVPKTRSVKLGKPAEFIPQAFAQKREAISLCQHGGGRRGTKLAQTHPAARRRQVAIQNKVATWQSSGKTGPFALPSGNLRVIALARAASMRWGVARPIVAP